METGYVFEVNNSEEGMIVEFTSPLEDGFMPVEDEE